MWIWFSTTTSPPVFSRSRGQRISVWSFAAFHTDRCYNSSERSLQIRKRDSQLLQGEAQCALDGLDRIGWGIEKPKVAASPGIGFGEYGDDYVRFVLVENAHRTRQAIRGIRNIM